MGLKAKGQENTSTGEELKTEKNQNRRNTDQLDEENIKRFTH